PFAGEEPDQPFVGLGKLVRFLGETRPCRIDDRQIAAHHVDEPHITLVQNFDVIRHLALPSVFGVLTASRTSSTNCSTAIPNRANTLHIASQVCSNCRINSGHLNSRGTFPLRCALLIAVSSNGVMGLP